MNHWAVALFSLLVLGLSCWAIYEGYLSERIHTHDRTEHDAIENKRQWRALLKDIYEEDK